ncbi:oxidoreductase [Stachybotrys elegans]|uniref:Oxidoreductase n=1 Tax=Stachybotrys elegans TaxID=80388 RepID=A0A8K0SIT1_9HYPO|nr:oxidoreductase [Stachybotrys elegans]
MTSKYLVVLAAAATTLASPNGGSIGAGVNGAGVTELFGNSFGVPGVNQTYDYIVIGGGTAGNAIAARLAQDPANYTVAVIEAGSFYEILSGNRTQVPGYNFLTAEPNFVTGGITSLTAISILSEPQAGYNNRRVGYTVGQTFGGGSAANYMGYFRPTIGSFDYWAEIVEDDYWNWENVYPAFKKSCDFTPPNYDKIDPSLNITYDTDAFDITGGPLQVSYGNFQGPFGPLLAEAMTRAGLDAIPGLNSGKLIGHGTATAAVDPRTATRSSSSTSFLQVGARTSNLKIYPNTLAQRIVFDEQKRASSVLVQGHMLSERFTYELFANKEIIVSGGVWQSPQLLMVSGVGPASTLESHGIEVVSDLAGVGQSEWDQPYMSLVYKVNVTTSSQIVAGNVEANAAAVEEYLTNQSGRLSGIGAGQSLGFEKFPAHTRDAVLSNSTRGWLASLPDDWPEAEYLPLESSPIPADIGPDDYYLLIGSALLATSSRGNMTIASADMNDRPIISPNWLLDKGDREQALAAFLRIREIAGNSTFVESEYIPGPEVTTNEEIVEWLRNNMVLIYHGSSTCKMGPVSDPLAVVDTRARVYGVSGLRVVDASAFPFHPPGQPMASVYMFAEKIAEAILEEE